MITLDLSILNQKGTPMFYSDIFANRPAAGVVGRIFISTDTYAIYRDTGSAWDQIGGSGSGITGSGTAGTLPIWTSSSALGDSSLLEGSTKITTIKDIQADGYYLTGMTGGSGALYWTSDRVTLANYNVGGIVHIEVNGGTASTIFGADLSLTNYGYIYAVPTLTAANNASSLSIYGQNTLSYAAGFSSNNIGAIYSAIGGVNLQTFAGSATFAQANLASGGVSVNSIDFSSAGSTITMTQSSGIRAMTGIQNQIQYQGTNSATISHAAISQNLGFYRPSGASGTLTITNAYSHLINALDDYGAGFTFTNRWGIYQAGASDKNYFAANVLLGSVVDNGNRLQVAGNAYIGNPSGNTIAQIQSTSASGESNVRLINTAASVQYDWQIQGIGTDGRFRIYDNAGTTGEWFTITQAGNIGVNTPSPAYKFDVNNVGGSTATARLYGNDQANVRLRLENTNGRIWELTGGLTGANNNTFTIYDATAASTRLQIDGSGNFGLGVTPSAYSGGNIALDIGGDPFSCINANLRMAITTNAYALGGTHYYRTTGLSSQQYRLSVGTNNHEWYIAPSGTAGNAINYTQAMTLNASGNLLIGNSVDRLRLTVSGSPVSNPSLGTASGTMLLCNNASTSEYGMMFGVASAGYGWIQQQRVDGLGTAYALSLQPSGGNLLVGTTIDTGDLFNLNGRFRQLNFNIGTTGGGQLGFNRNTTNGVLYDNSITAFQINGPSSSATFLEFQSYDTTGAYLGSMAFNAANLILGGTTDNGQRLQINGSIRINGQSSGTAGGSSGQHLIINLDGTTYKIALLNP